MDTIVCDPCKSRSRSLSASYWCPFCSEAFCHVCCQFHQTMKLTRSHKVQHISEVHSKDKLHDHGNRGRWENLTQMTFNEKTQLREVDNILLMMDSLSDTALTLKQQNFEMKMTNDARKNEALRKVVVFKTRLKELADVFEKHIAVELDYLQHAENVQIDTRIDECENILNGLDMSKDQTQALKTEYITSHTISKVNASRQRCNEYKFALQRVHSKMQPVQYNLAIDRNVSEAINTTPAVLGKIEVTHQYEQNNEKGGEASGSQISLPGSDTANNITKFKINPGEPPKLQEVYLHQKDDQDEPMITAICPLDSIHFVTLDRNNSKMLLVKLNGVVITQYVLTSQIWDMAAIDQTTLAVTVPDSDKIVVVKVRNSNLCAEKIIKTSNICHGISSIEGFLVVTVKGGYVKILTKAGEEVASVRHNSYGELLFQDPQYVTANKDQTEIYVSDYTLHTITALCLTGVKLSPDPRFVFSNNELRNPTGLAVDTAGTIYACGFSSHNIIRISADGHLLHVILSGIVNPQTCAITFLEDRLLVSCLQVGPRTRHMQNAVEIYQLR